MDGLALLCNLHADGPTTLHHLRTGGCGSLVDVANRRPADLESLLGWSANTVRRFQREARILAARLDTSRPEMSSEEEVDEVEHHGGGGFLEELQPDVIAIDPDEAQPEGGPSLGGAIPAGDAPRPASVEAAREPGAGQAETVEEESEWPERSTGGPEGTVENPEAVLDRSLSLEDCDGLTRGIVGKLARAGVHTLRDLVDGDVLEIASLVGIGYTRLTRIRFLVRRHIESLETGTARRVEVIPAPPPAASSSGDRLGASGPFA